jgi:putative transposase
MASRHEEDFSMPRKRHKAEEIVAKLRQVDVLVSQGKPVAEAVRSIAVSEVTYYRWRQEYGGLKGDQVKRLKELEAENTRLRRAISDLTLEKLILKEAASGNISAPPVVVLASTMSLPSTACRSGLPAEFSASTAPRNARSRRHAMTRRRLPPTSLRSRSSTAATAIVASRRCCIRPAGP